MNICSILADNCVGKALACGTLGLALLGEPYVVYALQEQLLAVEKRELEEGEPHPPHHEGAPEPGFVLPRVLATNTTEATIKVDWSRVKAGTRYLLPRLSTDT